MWQRISKDKMNREREWKPLERIPFVEYDEASEQVKDTYDKIKEGSGGHILNIFKVVGNQPEALEGLSKLILDVYRSGEVDLQLAELAYLHTSALNQCHY